MVNTICKCCKKSFSVARWRTGKAKYCSHACAIKGQTTKKSYDKPRICIGCKKKFLPTHWYQKHCSRECFCKSIKKTKTIKCSACGKFFPQVRLGQKFCSRECSSPYKNKNIKKPKHENLDTLWSKKVKEKAGNKCEVCGKETGLNSHHIFSRSNKRVRWDLDNGICVCVLHHVFGLFSAHKSPIEFAEWLKEKRGEKWYNILREKARFNVMQNSKRTKEDEEEIRKTLLPLS